MFWGTGSCQSGGGGDGVCRPTRSLALPASQPVRRCQPRAGRCSRRPPPKVVRGPAAAESGPRRSQANRQINRKSIAPARQHMSRRNVDCPNFGYLIRRISRPLSNGVAHCYPTRREALWPRFNGGRTGSIGCPIRWLLQCSSNGTFVCYLSGDVCWVVISLIQTDRLDSGWKR